VLARSGVGIFWIWGHVRHDSVIDTKADVLDRSKFMGSRPNYSMDTYVAALQIEWSKLPLP
jgi:hypothetical protein